MLRTWTRLHPATAGQAGPQNVYAKAKHAPREKSHCLESSGSDNED
jgi:hypothetical protein